MTSMTTLDGLKVAPTVANFPALIHVFDYAGCDFTEKTVTDSINGAVLNASSLDDYGSNSFRVNNGVSIAGSVGSIIAPGTTDTLIVSVHPVLKNDTISVGIGNIGTYGYETQASGAIISQTLASTNKHTGGANTISGSNAANIALATAVNWLDNTSESWMAESGVAIKGGSNTVTVGTIAGGMSQANLDAQTDAITIDSGTSNRLSGIYIFHFTSGNPTNIDEIAMWMALPENHGYIHPSLIGKS